jgi:hypothetical protein
MDTPALAECLDYIRLAVACLALLLIAAAWKQFRNGGPRLCWLAALLTGSIILTACNAEQLSARLELGPLGVKASLYAKDLHASTPEIPATNPAPAGDKPEANPRKD